MTNTHSQRLDIWLYYTRLAKTRRLCSDFIKDGRVRINNQRTLKPHAQVRTGDIISFVSPHHSHEVCIWQVCSLGERRGPAAEAATLYNVIAE